MEDFYRAIHMPTSLQELGIAPTDGDLKTMARKCAVASGGQKGSAWFFMKMICWQYTEWRTMVLKRLPHIRTGRSILCTMYN